MAMTAGILYVLSALAPSACVCWIAHWWIRPVRALEGRSGWSALWRLWVVGESGFAAALLGVGLLQFAVLAWRKDLPTSDDVGGMPGLALGLLAYFGPLTAPVAGACAWLWGERRQGRGTRPLLSLAVAIAGAITAVVLFVLVFGAVSGLVGYWGALFLYVVAIGAGAAVGYVLIKEPLAG